MNVLLIEDEPTIRENTIEMLELEGFNAFGAENGREGLKLIYTEHPDLIICDIQMPVMDGYEVIRKVKEDPGISHIPFIFFTARVEYEDETKGKQLGALAYLKKPFRYEKLIEVIREINLQ